MNENLTKSINFFVFVSVIAIIAMAICCLAALGYNSRISIEKEKIEVDTTSNFNLTNNQLGRE